MVRYTSLVLPMIIVKIHPFYVSTESVTRLPRPGGKRVQIIFREISLSYVLLRTHFPVYEYR